MDEVADAVAERADPRGGDVEREVEPGRALARELLADVDAELSKPAVRDLQLLELHEDARHRGGRRYPPQLPHSSARSGSAPGRFRSFHSTISQPRRRATSRKAGFGFTTTGFPTPSKSGTSALESE